MRIRTAGKGWVVLLGPAAGVSLIGLAAGCELFGRILQPTSVTVVLVNPTEYSIDADLYYSDTQEIPELLLTETGEQVQLNIPSGQQATFSRDCEELQALILEDARLNVALGFRPETGTGVLRDGDDFGCGDTITMTFSYRAVPVDFDVDVDVTSDSFPF